ncbi:hypothetical protein BDB01DRAFT_832263 [Pilobolus umbonatus]|nr:hypothetical protein BDB01DRAFT_832263 [Pilobolus umbonatus]
MGQVIILLEGVYTHKRCITLAWSVALPVKNYKNYVTVPICLILVEVMSSTAILFRRILEKSSGTEIYIYICIYNLPSSGQALGSLLSRFIPPQLRNEHASATFMELKYAGDEDEIHGDKLIYDWRYRSRDSVYLFSGILNQVCFNGNDLCTQ